MKKNNIRHRRKARQILIQTLYAYLLNPDSKTIPEQLQYAIQDNNNVEFDRDYLSRVFQGILTERSQLETLIQPLVAREKGGVIDPIEQVILWAGVFELLFDLETPYRVVINEALELAKKFGGVDSHKFINGILDPLAKTLRASEHASRAI